MCAVRAVWGYDCALVSACWLSRNSVAAASSTGGHVQKTASPTSVPDSCCPPTVAATAPCALPCPLPPKVRMMGGYLGRYHPHLSLCLMSLFQSWMRGPRQALRAVHEYIAVTRTGPDNAISFHLLADLARASSSATSSTASLSARGGAAGALRCLSSGAATFPVLLDGSEDTDGFDDALSSRSPAPGQLSLACRRAGDAVGTVAVVQVRRDAPWRDVVTAIAKQCGIDPLKVRTCNLVGFCLCLWFCLC